MLDIKEIQDTQVEIDNYQSTYILIRTNNQSLRIDFLDKVEFYLKKGISGILKFYETHPLLFDHNEKIVTTYINSKPNNIEGFIEDLKATISSTTNGWRDWTKYVTDRKINFTIDTFTENLKSGNGKLIEAPLTITQEVLKVCSKYQVHTKSFEGLIKQSNYKLMIIDSNYVIAKEFLNHN